MTLTLWPVLDQPVPEHVGSETGKYFQYIVTVAMPAAFPHAYDHPALCVLQHDCNIYWNNWSRANEATIYGHPRFGKFDWVSLVNVFEIEIWSNINLGPKPLTSRPLNPEIPPNSSFKRPAFDSRPTHHR